MIRKIAETLAGMAFLLAGMAIGWSVCVVGLGVLGVL